MVVEEFHQVFGTRKLFIGIADMAWRTYLSGQLSSDLVQEGENVGSTLREGASPYKRLTWKGVNYLMGVVCFLMPHAKIPLVF